TTAEGLRFSSVRVPVRLLAILGLVAALGLSGCGRTGRPALGARVPEVTTTTEVPFRLVATVHDALHSVDVFDAPGAPASKLKLSNPNSDNAKRVFLVKEQQ